jgi:ribosome-associated translation inhibitor RaiA
MKDITKKAQESLLVNRTKNYSEKIEYKLKQVREYITKINDIQAEIKKLEEEYESDKDITETTINLCSGSSLIYNGAVGGYPLYTTGSISCN